METIGRFQSCIPIEAVKVASVVEVVEVALSFYNNPHRCRCWLLQLTSRFIAAAA